MFNQLSHPGAPVTRLKSPQSFGRFTYVGLALRPVIGGAAMCGACEERSTQAKASLAHHVLETGSGDPSCILLGPQLATAWVVLPLRDTRRTADSHSSAVRHGPAGEGREGRPCRGSTNTAASFSSDTEVFSLSW